MTKSSIGGQGDEVRNFRASYPNRRVPHEWSPRGTYPVRPIRAPKIRAGELVAIFSSNVCGRLGSGRNRTIILLPKNTGTKYRSRLLILSFSDKGYLSPSLTPLSCASSPPIIHRSLDNTRSYQTQLDTQANRYNHPTMPGHPSSYWSMM
ncbi:hypothetical protein HYFRA_00000043 [Hymenoscyphus fraxineus]|uniref:Uncharacterized protein n=1 Tax=Hymenoscyphus fraxineus TaxID=746836 RepID=A0A9N9L3Y5_9HELO|nr:hypothetical protein HYFRA_00000043 [Hymenoscyphus fraxineus]